MKEKILRTTKDENEVKNQLPVYPAADDIYNRDKKLPDVDPEDLLKNKLPNEDIESTNEKDFKDDLSGDDLDIPGAELDDDDEAVGGEDEENNNYSIGGDDHNDLDEDRGE